MVLAISFMAKLSEVFQISCIAAKREIHHLSKYANSLKNKILFFVQKLHLSMDCKVDTMISSIGPALYSPCVFSFSVFTISFMNFKF